MENCHRLRCRCLWAEGGAWKRILVHTFLIERGGIALEASICLTKYWKWRFMPSDTFSLFVRAYVFGDDEVEIRGVVGWKLISCSTEFESPRTPSILLVALPYSCYSALLCEMRMNKRMYFILNVSWKNVRSHQKPSPLNQELSTTGIIFLEILFVPVSSCMSICEGCLAVVLPVAVSVLGKWISK